MNTKRTRHTSSHKQYAKGKNDHDSSMPVVDHLAELRSRVLLVLIILVIGTIAAFAFSDTILQAFINRFYAINRSSSLNIFDPIEGFLLRVKISFIVALYMFFPLVIIQAWKFIKPATERSNRFFYRITLLFTFLLFYAGTLLSYFYIHPVFIQLMLQFAPKTINKTINASIYLNQSIFICISAGILCELPVIIMILTQMGVITPQLLVKNRKYMIVLCWLLAAILSPPDIFTQIIFAIPLMILYEISILISKFIILRKRKRQ